MPPRDRLPLRAAWIEHWLAQHDLLAAVPRTLAVARLLDTADRQVVRRVRSELTRRQVVLGLRELEEQWEGQVEASRRRSQGVTYTPEPVIDRLLEAALAEHGGPTPVICDPACGSGGFLRRAAHMLSSRGVPLDVACREHLVGFDLDPEALTHARCLLELMLLAAGHDPRQVPLALYEADTLLTEAPELWARSGHPQGFDLVVTNPPYVKLQNLEPSYRGRLAARHGSFLRGNLGLAPLFLVAGHRMLAPQGVLGVVTQNNLFTSVAGRAVRAHLQTTGALRRIVDFGSERLFSGVSAYTCFVLLGQEATPSFRYARGGTESRLMTAELQSAKWHLAAAPQLEHLKRMEAHGTPLGQLARIRVGFATLKDQVFLVRQVGETVLGTLPDGRPIELEPGAVRVATKVPEVHTEAELRASTLRVIYPYRHEGGSLRPWTEGELAGHPATRSYLEAWRQALEGRDRGRRPYAAWYAWGRTQGLEAPGPKLLTPTFSRGPCFLVDPTDHLVCNGYALSLEPGAPMDLHALARLLNSRLMHYHARLASFRIAGEYECYQKHLIARFGVPDWDAARWAAFLALPAAAVEGVLAAEYGVPLAAIAEVLGPLAKRADELA